MHNMNWINLLSKETNLDDLDSWANCPKLVKKKKKKFILKHVFYTSVHTVADISLKERKSGKGI